MGMSNLIASYACFPNDSCGRLHVESPHELMTCFGVDLDRIVHSVAFRRLEYKTQVFVNHEGDHYRTRLTHSLEVSQVARTLAGALGLNTELSESIALAHDLGHTPFGHAGEDALNDSMKDFGGFNHNDQVLRILTDLESPFIGFNGLNLTWETLEGVVKHNGPVVKGSNPKADLLHSVFAYNEQHNLRLDTYPSGEAQVAALADDIAYSSHDIDDGLRAGLFRVEDLYKLPIVGEIFKTTYEQGQGVDPYRLNYKATGLFVETMIRDVVKEFKLKVQKHTIKSVDDIRNLGESMVHFSDPIQACRQELRAFLFEKMYHHYRVNRMTHKARRTVRGLFESFMEAPQCLPTTWQKQMESGDAAHKARTVADYIAGMTDRYAIQEYQKVIDLNP